LTRIFIGDTFLHPSMDGADTVQGGHAQIGQLVEDRFRAVEAQRIARTGEPGMRAEDHQLERDGHPPSQPVRPSGSFQKPPRSSLVIPPDPFVHPRPTASQTSGNPRDRPLLQPPAGPSLALVDQPSTFFDSYPHPPDGLEGLCTRFVDVGQLSTMCWQFRYQRCVVM